MIHLSKNIPLSAGVYIFSGKNGKPLYVGKAGNLKKRLAFYFRKNKGMPRTRKLLEESSQLNFIKTESEIEALIKEAELIKKFKPKYNILMKDDKNYLFVAITKEAFPKTFLTHQPKTFKRGSKIIGPFTNTASVKEVLKLLRKTFPYCTCKTPHKKQCLNAELGKCPGFCCYERNQQPTTYNQQQEYAKNIQTIVSILKGKRISLLITELKKDLEDAAGSLKYEQAAKIRDRLFSLQQILNHRKIISESRYPDKNSWPELGKKIATLVRLTHTPRRIEGYDISNISGTSATGSMVVFINGVPQKSEYRKFKIKAIRGPNDIAMLAEVITRRLKRREWEKPDLMLIDGGKPQLNATIAVLTTNNQPFDKLGVTNEVERQSTTIVALAKHDEELYIQNRRYPIQLKNQPAETLHFFQRIRDEAHRFAKKYHHKLRQKELYESR
ncbi:MAG: GIY-YIG nuclease family protein [Candidatus Sungbacteria bacterium]|nr:GIY-YIG nuclease family protein [Candidatus Sungbacteria bacterium]